MKTKSTLTLFVVVVIVMMTVLSSCNNAGHTNQSTLHLSPLMCGILLEGINPEEFCETKGKNTFLQNRYLSAETDKDGCLILTLNNDVIAEWKNSFTSLQVLQCVLGDSRQIGISIDYSKDYMDYMKDAHTCGFEISEDFTQVIESPEDNGWYYPLVMVACATMQVFEGKTCSEVRVEYLEVNNNGEIIEEINFPDNIENSSIPIE